MADNLPLPAGQPNFQGVSFQALITVLQNIAQNNAILFQNMTTAIDDVGFIRFVTPPATSASAGVAGQVAYDATHLYLCVGPSSWIRFTGSTF